MNAKLKQYALKKMVFTEASRFRVNKYKDVQDTRKIGFSKKEIQMSFLERLIDAGIK